MWSISSQVSTLGLRINIICKVSYDSVEDSSSKYLACHREQWYIPMIVTQCFFPFLLKLMCNGGAFKFLRILALLTNHGKQPEELSHKYVTSIIVHYSWYCITSRRFSFIAVLISVYVASKSTSVMSDLKWIELMISQSKLEGNLNRFRTVFLMLPISVSHILQFDCNIVEDTVCRKSCICFIPS